MNKDFLGRATALLLAILLSGSHLFIPRIPLLFAFLVLMGRTKMGTNWRISKKLFAPTALVLIILALEVTRSSSDAMQIAIRAANFSCALLLLNLYVVRGFTLLQRDLLALLRYLPHQTIATVIIGAVAPFLFITIPGTVVKTFFFVLYHHSPETGGIVFVRPDGFFWEPGILQLFLCLRLILSIDQKKPRIDQILTVLAIVLTQSTTGMINLCIILLAILGNQFIGRKQKYWALKLTGTISLVLIALFIAAGNLQEKMAGELRGSFYARSYDTLAGIEIISKHPWQGIGFTLETYLSESRSMVIELDEYSSEVFSEREGNSNGIITLLYTMGIPLGGLFILGIARQQIVPGKHMAPLILLLSIVSEPLTLVPMYLLISLSGLMHHKIRRIQRQRLTRLPRQSSVTGIVKIDEISGT